MTTNNTFYDLVVIGGGSGGVASARRAASYGAKVKALNTREQAKAYPDRYPTNGDSVAIEVVAKFDPKTKLFERPTAEQTESLKWLTQALGSHYGLDLQTDVYRHSDISYKQADEAKSLVFQ